MPNIKSAKKRVELTKVYAGRNQAKKTALKTSIKKFDAALAAGGAEASDAYKAAVKSVDRAVAAGIMHKNTAARKKSQLTLKLNNAK
ncbi:MAG: 30S ribosomal protein S20 [Clostridia bacterium]|nr:30S ribosomal protein S20 [Clostridia bacterium]